MKAKKKFKCKRCSACCLTVGRTFWKNGDFHDIPELDKTANNGDHEDNGLPCEMLEFQDGIGVCLIHKNYGYEAKPIMCKEFPRGELCIGYRKKK